MVSTLWKIVDNRKWS